MKHGIKKPIRNINNAEILTLQQKTFLNEFVKTDLKDIFRLSGGTALSAFYLENRLSEDLDFFSSENLPFYIPEQFLKKLDFVKDINFIKQFDRNIFNLKLKDKTMLKVEFTYYPFKNIEDTINIDNLYIDSFLDIIVNKLCAMADRREIKDYVDIYCAFKNSDLSLKKLIKLAEKKHGLKSINHVLKVRFLQIPAGLENLDLKIDITKNEIGSFFKYIVKEIVTEEIGKMSYSSSGHPGRSLSNIH